MNRRQIIMLSALGVFVGGIILGGLFFNEARVKKAKEIEQMRQEEALKAQRSAQGIEQEEPKYTTDVPKDAKLTEPQVTIPLQSSDGNKQGIFSIVGTSDGYEPSTITVNQGDVVTLRFESRGGVYDFSIPAYGYHLSVPEGGTKESSFKASTSGTFVIECQDACPTGKKIKGQLIIMPK